MNYFNNNHTVPRIGNPVKSPTAVPVIRLVNRDRRLPRLEKCVAIDNIKGLLISRCVFISQLLDFWHMPTKKHAYAELPPCENHASQAKSLRPNTPNSAFPRALTSMIKSSLKCT